jgi:hypothetical protein
MPAARLLASLLAFLKCSASQRWGLFFNPQTFEESFLKAAHTNAEKAKEA